MTIDPGIQLRFPGGLGLVVETGGTLLTQGTIDERVRLTPLVYPLSEPEIGTWGGVIINDAGPVAGGVAISDDGFGSFGGGTSTGVTSRLEYTRIEHAGGSFLMGDDFAVAKEDEGSLSGSVA